MAHFCEDVLGASEIKTTRNGGNPILDDLGIDLVGTQPLAIQLECGNTMHIRKFWDLYNNMEKLKKEGYQVPLYVYKGTRLPPIVVCELKDFAIFARGVFP
jgi:hypothetical protein